MEPDGNYGTSCAKLSMDIARLKWDIKTLIIEELNLKGREPEDIDDNAPLFGEGLGLDSLDALQLAMGLEERFAIRIPEGEQARAVFASVSALAAYVASEQGG